MQRTFVMIKPDAVRRNLVGKIINRFEEAKIPILALQMMTLNKKLAEKHYAEHKGKEFYDNVDPDDKFDSFDFHEVPMTDENYQAALHTNLGSLTVLDRLTGFGWRDIETGYRNIEGKFWLASGNMDVRESGAQTIQEAIDWVKVYANTCVGI